MRRRSSVDGSDPPSSCMRYVLIPLMDTAVSIGMTTRQLEADKLSDRQRDALARALSRTLETCELLVTYAVGVAGKPSGHDDHNDCGGA